MSNELLTLQPQSLWKYFYELTQIPRPSKHEEKVSQYVVEFGKKHGLETIVDEVGNVIIRKPATPGMENRKGVILQAHLDMVPQKNEDTDHDFKLNPLKPYVDGDWVKAEGTTLGADNGIGIAATMAVLSSSDLQHGPVEALFTIDEETGMTGAFGIKAGLIQGDILLNMDSEDEGELYIGCAGGTNANARFTYKDVDVPAGMTTFKLTVKRLKGGHSGLDIPLGRGNSNKILNRLMWVAERQFGLRLSSIDGGSLRNAIPRESFAVVAIPKSNKEKFLSHVKEFTEIVRKELSAVEPDLTILVDQATAPATLIDEQTQHNLLNAIYACPNGVIRMSNEMPGLVETSTSLAIVKSENGEIKLQSLLRSSVDSAKKELEQMIQSVFEMAGAEISFDGQYQGWKPNPDSPILKVMLDVYEKKFGKVPEIRAIHAGLECGILGGAYPNWDMISFGPTIRFPHSPDEKVNITTVEKFWKFLVETLKDIPVK
ncbi:MAG: aminoacyl-histidine dipeptidase [Deltaproteobacteria bacterium]|nr:aminoacyl-histidine dipeptidase [Deltaproteobacteria bacterium]